MPTVEGRGPVIVVGAGPGIGAAVARRFGGEGHPVGLVARNETRLRDLASTLGGRGITASVATADATDPGQVREALGALAERLGPPQILCFSPLADVALIKPVLETTPEDIRDATVAEHLWQLHHSGGELVTVLP